MKHHLRRRLAAAVTIGSGLTLSGAALADGGIAVGGTPLPVGAPAVSVSASANAQGPPAPATSVTASAGISTPAAPGRAHPRRGKHSATRTLASTAPDCTTNCSGLPLDFITSNDCTGELVEITGLYHVAVSTTTNGTTVTMTVNSNYQNSSGVALVTGTRYQANLTDNEYQRVYTLGVASDESISDNYELVSLSPTPNMIVRFAFSLHIDESGLATVGVNSVSANCSSSG
jgi:hypothetical protein